jgi:hypothetical protein
MSERCAATHSIRRWPYVSRCILDHPHKTEQHVDVNGLKWGPLPLPIKELPDAVAAVVKQALRNMVAYGYRIVDPEGNDVTEAVIKEAEDQL